MARQSLVLVALLTTMTVIHAWNTQAHSASVPRNGVHDIKVICARLSDRTSTRMACPEPVMGRESAYLSALQQATAFEVSGQRMSCLDDDRNLLVEFVASETPASE